ncbi:methionyl-tRNA formyltransferase [Haloarcula sp. GH36]|uniref:methionyl-tRNA formyltransferase n=1 Tax=Haloarcula montana TaxID=3111776 RepID=UPI002D77CF55|nr:methionyl-tRNA formyltransferase [Haloarcula sp. GH36]
MTERTVVIGNRKLAKYVFDHLVRTGWSVVGVVSPAEELAASQANYESVAALCDRHDVPLHKTSDINDEATRKWITDQEPSQCLCLGWGQVIRQPILDIPDRFLGFHASDLPRGRGGAPINWQILSGESEITLSLFEYLEEVDAGPIYGKERVPIQQRDTVATILEKIATAAMRLCDRLKETTPTPDPQSTAGATYRPRRQPQDGLIDWSQSTRVIFDWIRAQTKPYPGAYSFFAGEQVRVWEASTDDSSADPGQSPGTILDTDGDSVTVATGIGRINLHRVQRDGYPEQWADEWATSVGAESGDRLTRTAAPDDWTYTGIRGSDGAFDYDTALATGETGEILLVSHSGSNDPQIDVDVRYGSDVIYEGTLTETSEHLSVTYPAPDEVTALMVNFYDGSERIDRRVLKVYPTDGTAI